MSKRKVANRDAGEMHLPRCLIDENLINYKSSFVSYSTSGNPTLISSFTQEITDETVCFYDCYPFSGKRYAFPISFDTKKNEFVCWGNFCSLECAKAFIHESHHPKKETHFSLLSCLVRKLYGIYTEITKAPDKFLLKKFGGPLTIEEFRSKTSRTTFWEINKINCLYSQIIYDKYFNTDVFVPEQNYNKPERKKRENANDDAIVLKRAKGSLRIPKASLNTLVGKLQQNDQND
tara:strand:- start:308 stop:1009 length:702 start_codon:yes stop_codon:yes gene_type:complete